MSHRTAAIIACIGGGLILMGRMMSSSGGQNSVSDNFTAALAQAIAKAEGANPSINNPGDLTAGDVPESSITGVFNSAGVVAIDTLENGWNYLMNKLTRIMSGMSSVYSPDMTIAQFAQKYTGGDNSTAWANTVAGELGVTPDTTLAQAQTAFGG